MATGHFEGSERSILRGHGWWRRREIDMIVHYLSDIGLVFEGAAPLRIGDRLQLRLPLQGLRTVRVAWTCGWICGGPFDRRASSDQVRRALCGLPALADAGARATPFPQGLSSSGATRSAGCLGVIDNPGAQRAKPVRPTCKGSLTRRVPASRTSGPPAHSV